MGAISGVTLLTFMTIHLFQFRFGDTKPYDLCPPEYLVNIWPGVLRLVFLGGRDLRICQGSGHLPFGVRSFRIPWLGPVLHRSSLCVHHTHVPRLGQGRGRSGSWHSEEVSEQGGAYRLRDDRWRSFDICVFSDLRSHVAHQWSFRVCSSMTDGVDSTIIFGK